MPPSSSYCASDAADVLPFGQHLPEVFCEVRYRRLKLIFLQMTFNIFINFHYISFLPLHALVDTPVLLHLLLVNLRCGRGLQESTNSALEGIQHLSELVSSDGPPVHSRPGGDVRVGSG